MAQKRKLIMLLGGALVIIAAAILLISLLGKGGEEQGSELVVSQTDEASVLSIEVENALGTFAVAKTGDGYASEELRGLPVINMEFTKLFRSCTNIIATDKVSNAKPLDTYGLATPAAKVTINYKSGEPLIINVGNLLADGTGYYFNVQGQKPIYAGSLALIGQFLQGKSSYVDTLLAPAVPSGSTVDQQSAEVTTLKLVNANGTFLVRNIGYNNLDGYGNDYHYEVSVDGAAAKYVPTDLFNANFPRIMEMRATAAHQVFADDAKMADCGVTAQTSTASIEIEYLGEKSKVFIGNKTEGGYYAAKEGLPVIYIITEDLFTFKDTTAQALVSKFVFAPARAAVASIEVESGGKFYLIDVTEVSGKVDGQPLVENTFTGLYKLLCSVQNEFALGDATVEPAVARIEFFMNDGTQTTIALAPCGTRRLAVIVNGTTVGALRADFLDKLLSEFENLQDGKLINPVW